MTQHTERFTRRVFEIMRGDVRIAAIQDAAQATHGDTLAVVAIVGGSAQVVPFLRHTRRVLSEAVEIAIAEMGLPSGIVFGRFEIDI